MKWNLDHIFKSENDFDKLFKELKAEIKLFDKYKDKLSDASILEAYFQDYQNYVMKLYRAIAYVHRKSDLNLKDLEADTKRKEIEFIYQELNEILSFFEPEILQLPLKKYQEFSKKHKLIKTNLFSLEKLFKNQKHIFDGKTEGLLAIYSPVTSAYSCDDLYTAISVMDPINPVINLSDKENVTVTPGNWSALIENSKTENDRKLIFEALYDKYDKNKNTYAAIYDKILKANKADTKARGYDSFLEKYLESNQIPASVFLTLIDVARNNNSDVKRYQELKKNYLGLSQYHTYDRFLTMGKIDRKFTYEEGKALFFRSLEGLNEDFVAKQKQALADGFVDVYEQDGKQTGAYSASFHGLHPYILLNHADTLNDCFTIAHEAGHSAHSLFSEETQDFFNSSYTIFVAEIASTFNEHLLLDQLIKETSSKEEKIALLERAIENILGTFYRQTLFANYEYEANKLAENDVPINAEVLSKIMTDLYLEYYGIDLNNENLKHLVWCYIPHFFYSPFYVYQYATSFAASLKIYQNIKENKVNAFDDYLSLLKSGGSDYPVVQTKKAGADLTDKETFLSVVNRLKSLVDELEILLKDK
ncbi:MAG: oligoendopeptidase F [Erysipelotrichales bacterium]|nr:oligoendopeptidase F [Erysipelotrichales bacterium]